MKSLILRSSFAVLLLLAYGCSKIDWKDIFHPHPKGKNVVINKPVKAPVAITFLDANRLLSIQIPNVKVTLMDSVGQVVTPNYLTFSSLDIAGGVLSIALKESATFSEDNPYRFTIKAEAPGYITTSRSILIYNDSARYVPVFMTKIQDPPAGMAGFTGNIPIINSTVMTEFTLSPTISNKLKRKITVSIPQGTILMSNGKRLNQDVQNVSYNFVYASPSSDEALRTFPGSAGGTLITDAIDSVTYRYYPQLWRQATPQKPLFFISTGWMILEINSGANQITDFSKPINLIMPIESTLINPRTQKRYQVGDGIPSWSLNDKGTWIREGTSNVTASNDGLIAVMNIKHLSAWNLDNGTALCPATKTITYNNNTTMPHETVRAYCEIVGRQNGIPFGLVPGYDTNPLDFLSAGGTHDILNVPGMGDLTFLVYNSITGPGGSVRASTTFNCGTTPPVLNINNQVAYNSINLQFQYRVGTTPQPICNNAVFFLPGSFCPFGIAYRYGGMLRGPKGNLNSLNVGTTTLYQEGAFESNICIRLFYGTIASTALTTSHPIDFTINITNTDGLSHPADSITDSGITYQYFADINAWLITVPADGLGAISSCPL